MSDHSVSGPSPFKQKIRLILQRRHRILEWKRDYTYHAVLDLVRGLRMWTLWGRLGWQDVMLRYRRSILGPFWLTLSMGIMVFTLGLLYGGIFKIETSEYLPYLTVGLLLWGLINGMINEGCQDYIEVEPIIRQIDLPLSMFPLRIVWRNLILFMHNIPIFLVVLFVMDVPFGWVSLLIIPGVLIVLANGIWCATILGMLSARFRDLPQIVASIMQVAFFVTPIIWNHEQAGRARFLIHTNPFYHIIEMVRAPMLGKAPDFVNWQISLGIMVLGYICTFLFYRRFQCRIAYWV